MKILIDGEERAWKFDDESILSDVMTDINRRLMTEEHKVVVEVKIDDHIDDDIKSLTPDQVTIDRLKCIQFTTQPYLEYLDEELEGAETILRKVKDSMSTIVGHILSEELDIAMNSLRESIEGLIAVINLLVEASSIKAISIDDLKCGEGSFRDFLEKFNSTLSELTCAMGNNDTTLINDFLEYEMEPQIGELISLIQPVRESVRKFKF